MCMTKNSIKGSTGLNLALCNSCIVNLQREWALWTIYIGFTKKVSYPEVSGSDVVNSLPVRRDTNGKAASQGLGGA